MMGRLWHGHGMKMNSLKLKTACAASFQMDRFDRMSAGLTLWIVARFLMVSSNRCSSDDDGERAKADLNIRVSRSVTSMLPSATSDSDQRSAMASTNGSFSSARL